MQTSPTIATRVWNRTSSTRPITAGRAAASVATVLASIGLGLGLLTAGCNRGASGRSNTATASASAAAAVTELGPFRLGQQVRNRGELKLQLQLGGRGKPQILELSGDWNATPTDIHDGLVEMRCELANVSARIAADEDGPARAANGRGPGASPATSPGAPPSATARQAQENAQRELATALAVPFFVTYRPDGTISSLWFPRAVNPAIANLQMSLVGVMQLVRAADGQPAWIAQERDVNGEYTAAYRQGEQNGQPQPAGPLRFIKKKARYLQASALTNAVVSPLVAGAGTERLSPTIRIEQSQFELTADARGRLLEVRGEEQLVIGLGSPGLSMHTAVQIALRDGKMVDAPALVGAFARERAGLEARPLEQMGADAQAEIARRDRAILGGATFGELRRALDALPNDVATDAREAGALERRLEALFRLDSTAAAGAPAVVREQPAARGKLVVDALSMARTAQSAAALASVAKDPAVNKLARGNAIQYLAHQTAPAPEVVGVLTELLDDRDVDLRQMARLTYGACARSLRATAPQRATAITRELLTRWERSTSADERMELVIALGNGGGAESLSLLRRLAVGGGKGDQPNQHQNGGENTDPLRERTQAIEGLRFVEDPSVDELLMTLLRNGSDQSIRLAAIDAIRFRNVGPFASLLADVARTDAVATVRNAAVALLGDRLTTLPTLRPVLEDIRKSDQAPNNRELAARYLAAPGPDTRSQ